jgi:hypothetical protein
MHVTSSGCNPFYLEGVGLLSCTLRRSACPLRGPQWPYPVAALILLATLFAGGLAGSGEAARRHHHPGPPIGRSAQARGPEPTQLGDIGNARDRRHPGRNGIWRHHQRRRKTAATWPTSTATIVDVATGIWRQNFGRRGRRSLRLPTPRSPTPTAGRRRHPTPTATPTLPGRAYIAQPMAVNSVSSRRHDHSPRQPPPARG